MPTFSDLGVPTRAASDLAARGIAEPFAIQALTLPDALAGRDVAGKAPTGSGKTIAFGLAMVAGIDQAAPHCPTGLVLTPTRELAGQVAKELALLGRAYNLTVAAVYGGVGFGPQLSALRKGVDILVACPGRLADLIQQGQIELGGVQVAVIDEADRMADMGFLPEVRRLLDLTPESRQTLLFSATLDGDVDVLVRHYQKDPARHEVEADEADISRATHLFWRAGRDDKVEWAAQIVKSAGPSVIFSRTRHGAERLAKRLDKAGIGAVAIHGARSQKQRDRALADFTAGRAQALVATDVAARGIHVDDVAAVIHYDLPPDPKDYVHRSGRTARAGREGVVVGLVADSERGAATRLIKAVGLGIKVTDPDISLLPDLPPPPPRAKTRHEREDRPARTRDDRPARSRDDRPARPERADRWSTDRRDDRPSTRPSSDHRDRTTSDRPTRDTRRDERPSTRPGESRDREAPLRSRQAEQPYRRNPDGEAATGERSGGEANQSGMVRFYDVKKGFGFVIRPGRDDLFVHASALGTLSPLELTEGRPVTYTVEQGRKGEQASTIHIRRDGQPLPAKDGRPAAPRRDSRPARADRPERAGRSERRPRGR